MQCQAVTHPEQLDYNSSDKEGELRSFSPSVDVFSSSGGEEKEGIGISDDRPLSLLEFKKRLLVEKKQKHQKSKRTRDARTSYVTD